MHDRAMAIITVDLTETVHLNGIDFKSIDALYLVAMQKQCEMNSFTTCTVLFMDMVNQSKRQIAHNSLLKTGANHKSI